MKNNFINNVDIDLLPEFVQDAILKEFSNLSIKHKLIVYSKLVHGHLFKVTANDLFNINKQTPGIVYRNFIKKISEDLNPKDDNMEIIKERPPQKGVPINVPKNTNRRLPKEVTDEPKNIRSDKVQKDKGTKRKRKAKRRGKKSRASTPTGN
jgi:hypothetical protein